MKNAGFTPCEVTRAIELKMLGPAHFEKLLDQYDANMRLAEILPTSTFSKSNLVDAFGVRIDRTETADLDHLASYLSPSLLTVGVRSLPLSPKGNSLALRALRIAARSNDADEVLYTAVALHMLRANRPHSALSVLNAMLKDNIAVDSYSLSVAISACLKLISAGKLVEFTNTDPILFARVLKRSS
jgi:hypothetical protein